MNRITSLLITAMLTGAMYGIVLAQGTHQGMDEIIGHYQKIAQSLAADTLSGVKAEAHVIVQKAEVLQKQTGSVKRKNPEEWKKILEEVRVGARKLDTEDLTKTRAAFDALSRPLIRYVNAYEAGQGKYYVAECPMLKKSWVQTDKKITNPYYGKSMLGCGTIVSK